MQAGLKTPILSPEVNVTLDRLLGKVKAILGDQFLGMYLSGSLAGGGFTLGRSDIDFVVATSSNLAEETLQELEGMHAGLIVAGAHWDLKLEGVYVPQADLRCYNPDGGPYLCVNEGQVYRAQHDRAWVLSLHILREKGVVLEGPVPVDLIDPISAEDLKRAVGEILHNWWEPMLREESKLRRSDYQAFGVLSMCRVLHTLRTGNVVSKEEAAEWARRELGERFAALIDDALTWREGMPFERLTEVQDFIRYTLVSIQSSNF